MNPLTPNQQFTFVFQLGDPTDTSTNYVQSIVRYSATSAIIATMKLTSLGGQRFSGTFTVPADVSGQGYNLDITSTVYTDSGYSQPNINYPISTQQYTAIQPLNSFAMAGGDDGIDEATLIKVLERMLSKHVGGIKFPTPKDVDFSPITEKQDELLDMMVENRGNHIITHAKIDNNASEINKIPKSYPIAREPKEVDLYPLIEGIQNIHKAHDSFRNEMIQRHAEHEKRVAKMIEDSKKYISDESSKRIKDTIDEKRGEIFTINAVSQDKKPEPKPKPIDERIKRLLSPYAKI